MQTNLKPGSQKKKKNSTCPARRKDQSRCQLKLLGNLQNKDNKVRIIDQKMTKVELYLV